MLLAALVIAPTMADLAPGRAYVIASGSMAPEIPRGSIVFATAGEADLGDVVVYDSASGVSQVHRVVEVRVDDAGRRTFVTRGDANDAPDPFVVASEDTRGVVRGHVPLVGHVLLVSPHLRIAGLMALVGAYLAITIHDARRAPPRRPRLEALLVIACVLTPGAFAGVALAPPESSVTAGVLTPPPLPHAPGTDGSASVTESGAAATATVTPPKLWKEITMYNCRKENGGTCTMEFSAHSYREEVGSMSRIRVADYSPAPVFFLEAAFAAPVGYTASVVLYDRTSGVDVAGSEISSDSTALTLQRSGGFTLSGEKDYTIRTKHSGPGGSGTGGELRTARLVVVQEGATSTVEQIRLAQGTESTTTAYAVPARAGKWQFDGASMDGVTAAYFEAVAEVDGSMLTDSHIRLVDRTAGTVVAELTVTVLDTAPKRFRSADIRASLVDGHEYEVEYRRGDGALGNLLKLHVARVIVLQSSFTSTVRYVDLSWTATSTSTSFASTGYDGRYHMDTEWGGRTGYFEATISNSGSGTTALQLMDRTAGAAVSGSQVDVTGTTRSRVRSDAITLNPANGTYGIEIRADSGTAEVRNAWLVVLQAAGKTFDHVLETRHPTAESCSWDFTLTAISSDGLARLTSATIGIRGNGALLNQVVVQAGAFAATTGTAATVPTGGTLEYVVTTRPSSDGTTTITTRLDGKCSGTGLATSQTLTFRFT